MLKKLIHFYKDNLDVPYLGFRHYKLFWSISGIALIVCSIVLLIIDILNLSKAYYILIGIVFFALSILCVFFYKKTVFVSKVFIVKGLKIRVSNLKSKWEIIDAVDEKKAILLLEFLKDNNLDNTASIERIIKFINEKIDRWKFPKFTFPAILISLYLPFWVQLVTKIYNIDNSIEHAVKVFTYSSVGIISIVTVSYAFVLVYDSYKGVILPSIFNTEVQKMRTLIKLLEDCSLRIKNK